MLSQCEVLVGSAWWPVVVCSLVIGVVIGLGVARMVGEARAMDRARYLHPSWSEHGDKGVQGERWEQPTLGLFDD